MRPYLLACAALLLARTTCSGIFVPDANFRNWLNAQYPGALTGTDLNAADTRISSATDVNVIGLGITDLTGIEAFTHLNRLQAQNNNFSGGGLHYPSSTTYLDVSYCQLTGVFFIPPNLTTLIVWNNQLTRLIFTDRHDAEISVMAMNNQITEILPDITGTLPPMTQLDVDNNLLTSLPPPNGANGIMLLDIANNRLTTIQDITPFTYHANFAGNLITSIGNLSTATGLRRLYLNGNPLNAPVGTQELPPGLTSLNVSNSQLACLPWLPYTLQTLLCTGTPLSCLPNTPPPLDLTAANYGFTPALCPSTAPCYIAPPGLQVKMALQGPWDAQAHLMRDDLRQRGLLPTTEPYSAMGFTYTGNTTPLTVPAAWFDVTGPDAIVDWVLVELLNPSTYALLERRPALLQRDGDVIGTDGAGLFVYDRPRGTYNIGIRHRNHLSTTTNTTRTLTNGTLTVNFMQNGVPRYTAGDATNTRLLWAGDVNADRKVMYTGANNDRDPILVTIGGTVPTNVISGQYRNDDINMDGDVKYTGVNNDRDPILSNIGGTTPTAVLVQVPNF